VQAPKTDRGGRPCSSKKSGVPRRRGYGTELIQRLLPYDLGAETRLEFGPEGVHRKIAVPIGG